LVAYYDNSPVIYGQVKRIWQKSVIVTAHLKQRAGGGCPRAGGSG